MTIIKSEFSLALNQVATERGISPNDVLASIEQAILAAFKKEYPDKYDDEMKVKINKDTGEVKIIKDKQNVMPPGFGRIATQTAKQVILQTIREVEKKTIASHYQSHIGTIMRGRVIRFDGINIYFDIGKAEAVLPKEEQIKNEEYQLNNSLVIYLKQIVNDKFGNPRIIVSRVDPRLIEELFKREVPEIANGTVVIKKVVREPGERAKIAVFNNESAVDPVGACVGQKGIRVQTVTDELGGQEKIDIIQWNKNDKLFLTAALSPAKIVSLEINEKNKTAQIYVDEDQAPLAIGRGGVNVNLASRLTGFVINIVQKEKDSKIDEKIPEESSKTKSQIELKENKTT